MMIVSTIHRYAKFFVGSGTRSYGVGEYQPKRASDEAGAVGSTRAVLENVSFKASKENHANNWR